MFFALVSQRSLYNLYNKNMSELSSAWYSLFSIVVIINEIKITKNKTRITFNYV